MSGRPQYSGCKAINEICKGMVKAGWLPKKSKKHSRLVAPDGKFTLTVPTSPSDHRAALNFISDVRRQGVTV